MKSQLSRLKPERWVQGHPGDFRSDFNFFFFFLSFFLTPCCLWAERTSLPFPFSNRSGGARRPPLKDWKKRYSCSFEGARAPGASRWEQMKKEDQCWRPRRLKPVQRKTRVVPPPWSNLRWAFSLRSEISRVVGPSGFGQEEGVEWERLLMRK